MVLEKKGVRALKIAAAYIGTVVGAGFATGQEILQFFVGFGISGLFGIVLTTVLFITFGYIIMSLGYRLYASSHLEIIKYSGGSILGRIMDFVITFFLFGALTAMVAGTGALFKEQLGLPAVTGNLLMAIISAITVLTGIKGVINSISIIVPFLLVSVFAISIASIIGAPPSLAALTPAAQSGLTGNWLIAGIVYTAYNTVMSVAVLAPLGAQARDEKAIRIGAVLGGLGLGLGALMIFLSIAGGLAEVKDLEVPMASIAARVSPAVRTVYSIVLIAEVYTTAVGSLYGFCARMANFEKTPLRGRTIVIATSVAAFFASLFGFSSLVKYLYPAVGYAGILLLASLLYRSIKPKRIL